MKYFVWCIIIVVAGAVAAGFFIIGSPQEQRLRRFDERRVQDLQIIQSEIIHYRQLKERLPETLEALRDDIRGFAPPRDPKNGEPYEYAPTGPLSFSLCAVFDVSAESPSPGGPYYETQNWNHDAGSFCFDRTIDKDLYPAKRKNL